MTKDPTKKGIARSATKENIAAPTSKIARPQRTSAATTSSPSSVIASPTASKIVSSPVTTPTSPSKTNTVDSHVDCDKNLEDVSLTTQEIMEITNEVSETVHNTTNVVSTFDWAQEMQQIQLAHARQLEEQKQQMAEYSRQLAEVFVVLKENKQLKTDLAQLKEALAEVEQLKSGFTATQHDHADVDADMDEHFPSLGAAGGSGASKFAHEYEPTGVSTKKLSFRDAALKPIPKGQRKKFLTLKQRQAIARMFEPPRPIGEQTEATYEYVYFSNKFRSRISIYRRKLRQLGVDNGRVLDIHYPCCGVVALLIHTGYRTELLEILGEYKFCPLESFDPLSPATITDPQLSQLTSEERTLKAQEF